MAWMNIHGTWISAYAEYKLLEAEPDLYPLM